MEKYSELQQNSIYEQLFTVALPKKTIRITPGIYNIDESSVKIDFAYTMTTDLHSVFIRKDACLLFQGLCQVKQDGILKGNYQNLMAAQLIYYYTNPNYFKENENIIVGNGLGKQSVPDNLHQLQDVAVDGERSEYSWTLRHFFPFLFKSDQKYFQVTKQIEITIVMETVLTDMLLNVTNLTSAQAALAMADSIKLQICLQKSTNKIGNIEKFNNVFQQEEVTSQTETEIKVDNEKQFSKFQAIMLIPQGQILCSTFTKITPTNFTDCKLQMNEKYIIKGDSNSDVLCQFQLSQVQKTGNFLISLFQIGQNYTIQLQNTVAANTDLNLITLIQFQD